MASASGTSSPRCGRSGAGGSPTGSSCSRASASGTSRSMPDRLILGDDRPFYGSHEGAPFQHLAADLVGQGLHEEQAPALLDVRIGEVVEHLGPRHLAAVVLHLELHVGPIHLTPQAHAALLAGGV